MIDLGINDRIDIATKNYPLLRHLPKGIYRFNAKANNGRVDGLATIKYAGDQLLSLAKVIIYVMYKSVTDDELRLVLSFVHFLFLVRSGGESRVEELANIIFDFKSRWVATFDPNERNSNNTKKYTYQFPNFDSVDAWPRLLQYLGPSYLYSTELWEIMHKPLRHQKLGNFMNPDYDALSKHAKQKALDWEQNDDDSNLETSGAILTLLVQ